MKTRTFYFNTGVKPTGHQPPIELFGCQVWKDGTKQIPFTCENVPDNARFMFACDSDDLPESKRNDVIVREILNNGERGGLLSKYAYFTVKPESEVAHE